MRTVFRFNIKSGSSVMTVFGIAGLLALAAFLGLPSLLAPSLDTGRAEREVRQFLIKQLVKGHMAELSGLNLSVPDRAMATRWHEEYSRIENLEFASVKVGRLPYLPFSSSRTFMVKAVIRNADNDERTRYFSLSARSRLYEAFWVAEQSRWLWLLAF